MKCPNAPACLTCMMNSTTSTVMCMTCSLGYYLNNGTCQACQAFCISCTNSSWCLQPYNTFGFTLVAIGVGNNTLAACDFGCLACSSSYPEECVTCGFGFYMVPGQNYCQICPGTSNCKSCNASAPAQCLTCFVGAYLNSNNVCQNCSYPCASCINNVATTCSSCVQGFVYVASNNSCLNASTLASNLGSAVENCANQELTGSGTSSSVFCSLCLQGYVPTPSGCVPCAEGCLVCNPSFLDVCSQCISGWSLNGSNVCVNSTICSEGCSECSEIGCLACEEGMYLNQAFQCQFECVAPCATCSNLNPFQCLSCVLGYTLSGSTCQPATSCNTNADCLTCPFGSTLQTNNNAIRLNQTC